MPFDGSGGFDPLAPPVYPAVAGEIIYASRFNSVINDILTGLGSCVVRDGQAAASANLPMGGFKHTGAGDASGAGQYLVYGQALAGAGSDLDADFYTPTVSSYSNIDSYTMREAFWIRVGNVVMVTGRATVNMTSPAAQTYIVISLPVATNHVTPSVYGLNGVASIDAAGSVINSGYVYSNGQNPASAIIKWYDGSGSDDNLFYAFKYKVVA
jgi:hypothetical protein